MCCLCHTQYCIGFFFKFIYFKRGEGQAERERDRERQREKDRERESQAGSVLSEQSLTWGSISGTMRS